MRTFPLDDAETASYLLVDRFTITIYQQYNADGYRVQGRILENSGSATAGEE
jgi:hypothetical protein